MPIIGRMRERLAILEGTRTSDGGGGRSVVWTTLDTVQAELIPLKATERLQAEAVQSVAQMQFRIRARGDVTPKMRVSWRPSWLALGTPKDLEIHGVTPDATDPSTFLMLECGEVAS